MRGEGAGDAGRRFAGERQSNHAVGGNARRGEVRRTGIWNRRQAGETLRRGVVAYKPMNEETKKLEMCLCVLSRTS